MMRDARRKARVMLGLSAVAVATAALLGYLLRDSPHRAVFRQLRLTQSEAAVADLVKHLPADTESDAPLAWLEWQGAHAGERIDVRVSRDTVSADPVLRRSLLVGTQLMGNAAPATRRRDIARHYFDPAHCVLDPGTFADPTGRTVARQRTWRANRDAVAVIFDADGRVIERAYVTFGDEPSWMRWARETLGPLSPW
jgi:hypothetical protein